MSNQVTYIISLKDLFTQKIKEAEGATDALDKKFNKLEGTISTVAKAAAAYFSFNAIKDFISGVVQTGAEFERAEIGLTTLLKSADKAKEVFANIKEDAATTPFDVQSLLKGNSLLISAGVSADQARKDVLALGNAVAATGGGSDELQRMLVNLQQIKNTGKATGIDIKQFAYAGINIYGLLADATGKSTAEVKDMEVSYELLTYALNKAQQAGGIYEGGLARLSKSTAVQISNLGDAVLFLKNDLFLYLKPAIDSVISASSHFIGVLREGVAWMQEHSTAVKTAAVFIGVLAAGIGLYNGYVAAARIATLAWATAQAILNGTMALNPVGLIITGIAALAAGIYYCWTQFEGFRGAIMGTWEAMKTFITIIRDGVLTVLSGLGLALEGFQTGNLSKIQSGLKSAASGFLDAVPLTAALTNGKKLGAAFKKGYNGEIGKKNGASISTSASSVTTAGGGESGLIPGGSIAGASADKVGSVKPTTINITIGKFQDSINFYTTNLQESASKAAEVLNKALLSSVNDVNRLAGI